MKSQAECLESALPTESHAAKPLRWLPVRDLAERHRDRVRAHLLALTDQDRYLRFGHVATDEQISRYVEHLDFDRDEVFGVFDDRLTLVAMAHLAYEGDASLAEFGVSVHPHLRGRGIGGRLFHHAVTHARNRGAHAMAIHIARENTAMLGIVRRAGAQIRFEGSDATAQLGLPADTLGSQLEEFVERQAADLDYRIKLQVLRLDRLWPSRLLGRREDN
jgi:GNAT superfamily N-acetyltransferase